MELNDSFIPSKEQSEIFNFIKTGVGDAVINACAGSGKSTTILQGIKYIPDGKNILFISFNKPIVTELINKSQKKYSYRTGKIRFLTFHGLGYRMFCDHFSKQPNINEKKYVEYVNKTISTIAGNEYMELSKHDRSLYRHNVLMLIEFSRLNLCQNQREIGRICKKYEIPVIKNEINSVVKILRWGSENIESVDFLDLVWLPSELNYFSKPYMSDFIFIDEAQDTSPVQQELIKRCIKRDTRVIAVGDKYQTINAWCGSDQEAFEHIKKLNNGRVAKEFMLSTSYRCPKKLVKMASEFAPNIFAKDDAIDGEFNITSNLSSIKPGDLVLCRNLAPLIKLHRQLSKEGKLSYIKNMEFGETLKDIISSTDCDTAECLLNTLKCKIVNTWHSIIKSLHCEPKECVTEPYLFNMYETYKIIEDIMQENSDINSTIEYLTNIFSASESDGAIVLSTIHRAKGLEADNVYVICPSTIPSPLAKKDWEIAAEKYLQYVMITRLKKSLNMVDESQFSPGKWVNSDSIIYNELKQIENEMASIC